MSYRNQDGPGPLWLLGILLVIMFVFGYLKLQTEQELRRRAVREVLEEREKAKEARP